MTVLNPCTIYPMKQFNISYHYLYCVITAENKTITEDGWTYLDRE